MPESDDDDDDDEVEEGEELVEEVEIVAGAGMEGVLNAALPVGKRPVAGAAFVATAKVVPVAVPVAVTAPPMPAAVVSRLC